MPTNAELASTVKDLTERVIAAETRMTEIGVLLAQKEAETFEWVAAAADEVDKLKRKTEALPEPDAA